MNLLFFSPLLIASMVSATGSAHYGGVPVSSPIKKVISPPLNCRTEYVTLWDTSYQETEEDVCVTVYEKECQTHLQRLCQPTTRQECHIEYNQQCETVYKNVCVEKLSTEYEPFTETECSTLYKEECQHEWQGEGNDKVWVPIAGTCQNLPYDECKEVTKTHTKQVAQQVCHDVPEQKCVKVPNQVCVTVPDQVCTNEPLTKCQDVPKQQCHSEHKRIPIRVSRREPKKSCDQGYEVPVQHLPVHQGQQVTSVTSLLGNAEPAVPVHTQPTVPATLPEIITTRQTQNQDKDRLIFTGK